AVVPAVVALGSVFKCSNCNDWHVGNVAAGWIASPDGLVVTNHHVLERPPGNHLGVMTSDGEVLAVTDVVAADAARDTAVIRVDPRGRKLPHLGLGAAPGCGSSVTIISHPKGRFFSLTKGVVSRYHRMRYGDQPNRSPPDAVVAAPTWMTVTAEFAIGSSGGPVFDEAGRVVGMVSRTSPGGALAQGKPKEPPPPGGEQMIFRECVPVESLRSLFAVIRAP
ncbi:MAG: serine protease, partial [Planctomycetia bacterium]